MSRSESCNGNFSSPRTATLSILANSVGDHNNPQAESEDGDRDKQDRPYLGELSTRSDSVKFFSRSQILSEISSASTFERRSDISVGSSLRKQQDLLSTACSSFSNLEKSVDSDDEVESANARRSACIDGKLAEDVVAQGISNLGFAAEGTKFVFLDLFLPGYNLKDISLLQNYQHLQKVELPYNEIEDLSALGDLPFLAELDVSRNQIGELLNFKPPLNLVQADFSFNLIKEIPPLGEHKGLHKLILDHNQIKRIEGLSECRMLHVLSIAHNQLERMENLDGLPLQQLNLDHNAISDIGNLESLSCLQKIDMSSNQIRSMSGLKCASGLMEITLQDNQIVDFGEVLHISNLKMLTNLSLLNNPILDQPDIQFAILAHLPQLVILNTQKLSAINKVKAINMYNPSKEVVASRDHIMHTTYGFLRANQVRDSTLPSLDTPYPMLVLVGPKGTKKKDISLKLVADFPEIFGYGLPTCTRQPRQDEANLREYEFISVEQFEENIKQGKFLQSFTFEENLFGLKVEKVEEIARAGLACVTHMELEGTLSLKKTYLEPRYVLLLPSDEKILEERIKLSGITDVQQARILASRIDEYLIHNQEFPGYFDTVLDCDSLVETYKSLCRLVSNYINSGESASATTASSASGTRESTGMASSDDFFKKRKIFEHKFPIGHSPNRLEVQNNQNRILVSEQNLARSEFSPEFVSDKRHSDDDLNIWSVHHRAMSAPDPALKFDWLSGSAANEDPPLPLTRSEMLEDLTLPEGAFFAESTDSRKASARESLDTDSKRPLAPRQDNQRYQPTIISDVQVGMQLSSLEQQSSSLNDSSNRPGSSRHPVLPPIGAMQD